MTGKELAKNKPIDVVILGLQLCVWMTLIGFVVLIVPRIERVFWEFEIELPKLLVFLFELGNLNWKMWAVVLVVGIAYGTAHFGFVNYVVRSDLRLRWRVRLLAVPVSLLLIAIVLLIIAYLQMVWQFAD